MVERQDIDALLISALYGELTPADETRLATHLDSHPADRTALADLTRAREVVRESRILQVQLEPPQSISALLLQEAARRAPRKPSEDGLLARFLRSFMAHPALAAAAMLVVVIGFATVISSRKGDQFVESKAPVVAVDQVKGEMQAQSAAPEAAGSGAASVTTKGGTDQSSAAPTTGADRGVGDAYRVGLDDPKPSDVARTRSEFKPSSPKSAATAESKKDLGYIELRKEEPAPKELDSKNKLQIAPNAFDQEAAKQQPMGNAETTGRRGAVNAPSTTSTPAPMREAPGAVEPQPAQASSPPPPPKAPAAITRDDRAAAGEKTVTRPSPSDDKSDPQVEWASAQHKRVTKQVRDGNCQDAATLALEIARRAPSYYQQNVATDRELKKCLSYINSEREKEAERTQRKPTKRAMDEPAKASPSKPADKPAANNATK